MNLEAVSLDEHLVIEASAGTGKTFAMTRLIIRLLLEAKAKLPEILVVTYTDKATGELKDRVRGALEDDVSAAAREALDLFDQASIFTIHGFCQRMLRDNAFAHGQEFAADLADDGELFEPILREAQRREWVSRLGASLSRHLAIANYGDTWETSVRYLARDFKAACGHTLLPDVPENLEAWLADHDQRIRDIRLQVQQLARLADGDAFDDHPWLAGLAKVPKIHGTDRNTSEKYLLRPLLEWLTDPTVNDRPLEAVLDRVDQMHNASHFPRLGFRRVFRDRKDNVVDPGSACGAFPAAIPALNELFLDPALHDARHMLAAWTARLVQETLKRHKQERALRSFDDMLRSLDEALVDDQATRAIRDRYKYAIVDEFQDTDPIQWRIFDRVFASSASHRLFLVGDPKQSIFGFRGADVHAYSRAIDSLEARGLAKRDSLETNWRAIPPLIDALNQIFDQGGFFADTGIPFAPATSAGELSRYRVERDDTGAAPLTLLPWDDSAPTDGLRAISRQAAREMKRLLGEEGPLFAFQANGQTRPLEARDICALVAKRQEARFLVDELRCLGIPYTFFKEPGLWQSDQARDLELVLRAVAQPDSPAARRLALLSSFFAIAPADVVIAERESVELEALRSRWTAAAGDRDWAGLFHSIVYDTGVLHRALNEPDAERRRANLLHIVADLQATAYRGELDLFDLVHLLAERRREDRNTEIDIQPRETERSKIQIMTIHASKGLEFPIVFLLGGFTKHSARGVPSIPHGDGRVFDLRGALDDAAERLSEDARLYYVALTRAIFKLYMPYKATPKGLDGPLTTLVGRAITDSGITAGELANVAIGITPPRDAPSPAVAVVVETAAPPLAFEGDLFIPGLEGLAARRTWLVSFSSLKRRRSAIEIQVPSAPLRDADEPETPTETAEPFRGVAFGDIVHQLVETLDFQVASQARSADDYHARLGPTPLEICRQHWSRFPPSVSAISDGVEQCARAATRMIFHALTTTLPEVGRLCDLPSGDLLRELEFLFPDAPVAGDRERRFYRGSMDMLFRAGGRFYLLDWKTNDLPDGYGPASLAEAMRQSGYDRQFRLYLIALERWLSGRVQSFEPTRDLGGVFYLFVRGMNARAPSDGVVFHRPTPADFDLSAVVS